MRRDGCLLPVEPFKEWLVVRLEACQRESVDDAVTHGRFPLGRLEDRTGISARYLSEVLRGRTRFVKLDTVDKAVCTFGDPFLLYEFYPHLMERGWGGGR